MREIFCVIAIMVEIFIVGYFLNRTMTSIETNLRRDIESLKNKYGK